MEKGIIAHKGISIAKAFKLEKPKIIIKETTCDDINTCLKAFDQAILQSTNDLKTIKENAKDRLDSEHLAIFDAHIEMINDVELIKDVKDRIQNEHLHPAKAYDESTKAFITMFESMEDEYFKERALDIKDIAYRVLSYLVGNPLKDLTLIDEPIILIAKDLTPSDTALLNKTFVLGFITELGGYTSHTAIMARALDIPAIVGVKGIMDAVKNGDLIALDAIDHEISIHPSETLINNLKKKKQIYLDQLASFHAFKDKATKTQDGHSVKLYANIGSSNDIPSLIANGAEGVGLFRTEFLFMDSQTMPTLDDQIKAYKDVFDAIDPVIVRTLDIGGDKALPYLKQDQEDNPFLGERAIRLCFNEVDLFKTQLKALLIASKDQSACRIMFPMIARLDELVKAKKILNEVTIALDQENIAYQKNIKVGIMIEIPSAALNISAFKGHIDFISIGSNDLIQYLYAADRMNEKVAYLYEPFDPTLLRLLNDIITKARDANIESGLCGELGGVKEIALLLVAMQIDEISMTPAHILEIRALLSTVTKKSLDELLADVLALDSAGAVKDRINKYLEDKNEKH
ncbi:MAG: phosphoenolpyruvate--protein phosphotransferase [Candidatus Izemoplasmataceae bacterium]